MIQVNPQTFRKAQAQMGGQYFNQDLKEIGISTMNWVDSAQDRDYWKALGNECDIEPPGSLSHEVSQFFMDERCLRPFHGLSVRT